MIAGYWLYTVVDDDRWLHSVIDGCGEDRMSTPLSHIWTSPDFIFAPRVFQIWTSPDMISGLVQIQFFPL